MKKIKITIVDSGVRRDHPLFQEDDIQGFTYLGQGKTEDNFQDCFGHGTAIYGIIRQAKKWADIINIRIPDIEEGIEEEILCSVLDYIAEKVDTDILNLSLGSCCCMDLNALRNACSHLIQKKVVIMSAFDNAGAVSYPAAFPDVIGVTSGEECARTKDFIVHENGIVDLAAKGAVQKLAWLEPDYILLGGNSFACAHATVQAVRYMAEGTSDRENILRRFKEDAIRVEKGQKYFSKASPLNQNKNAAVFPFCKETQSMLRFYDLLNFHITDIYDIKYSAIVGACTNRLMKDDNVLKLTVKNIENIEWDKFDTLIIGHMWKLSSLVNDNNFFQNLIKEAEEHEKKIVAFDDLSKFVSREIRTQVYYPYVDKSQVPFIGYGKLYRPSKPVLGIFGTSSHQGKFTLQLILRRKLIGRGYHIGQIGTEPSSLLYGMDGVYPMGYNSSVHITGADAVRYLNYQINELCEKENDLIIVGSQSGTVPYDYGNLEQYTFAQFDLLMGTLPDAVILCVNPFDDIEYVERTIHFIESSVECKVIGLSLFPLDFKNESFYGNRKQISQEKCEWLKKEYSSRVNLPLYPLGKEDEMEMLVNRVIEYFEE